jgi:serine/threonine protein kinase
MELTQLCMGCMEPRDAAEVCPRCSWSDTYSVQPQFYLPPHTTLMDRFTIGRALGYGGYSVTYLAWDSSEQRKTVVKEYLPGGMITRSFGNPMALILTPDLQPIFDHGLSLFVREAEAVQSMGKSGHFYESYAIFRQNGTAYQALEWLEGMDFATYMQRHPGGISVELALRMLLPVVEGLERAHALGITHENLAPSNIFLTRSAQVKTLDFGHARRFLRRQVPQLEFGIKDGYAAEEQYRPDGSVGPWTDLYSIACIFYFALSGKTPPPSPERAARDYLTPLAVPNSDVHNAVLRGMQVHGPLRFASMEDFHRALMGQKAAAASGFGAQSAGPGDSRFGGSGHAFPNALNHSGSAQGAARPYSAQGSAGPGVSPSGYGAPMPAGFGSNVQPDAPTAPQPVMPSSSGLMGSAPGAGPDSFFDQQATRILPPIAPPPSYPTAGGAQQSRKFPLWLVMVAMFVIMAGAFAAFLLVRDKIPAMRMARNPEVLRFEIEPSRVSKGNPATLVWEVSDAAAVTINGAAVKASGRYTVTPNTTSIFHLIAADAEGRKVEVKRVLEVQ